MDIPRRFETTAITDSTLELIDRCRINCRSGTPFSTRGIQCYLLRFLYVLLNETRLVTVRWPVPGNRKSMKQALANFNSRLGPDHASGFSFSIRKKSI